jgi:hypothetical protein
MPQIEIPPHADRLLIGAPDIAAFLGIRQKQVEHMIAARLLPTFKLGGRVCARSRTLVAWLDKREREATARDGGGMTTNERRPAGEDRAAAQCSRSIDNISTLPFDKLAPILTDLGYQCVPIKPGTKAPEAKG